MLNLYIFLEFNVIVKIKAKYLLEFQKNSISSKEIMLYKKAIPSI